MIFSFAENMALAERISQQTQIPLGQWESRQFPDGEFYLRVQNSIQGKHVFILASLFHPNAKTLLLYFLAKNLKELGATQVGLVAPYLAYMRQDKRFKTGEALSAKYYAQLLSQCVDWIITVDPHLHRYHHLNEIYTIPSAVLHATLPMAKWIKENISHPLLIGPDEESSQWVESIAQKISAPWVILKKQRLGDRRVKIYLENLKRFQNHQPLLVDDIISSGKTMMETMREIQNQSLKPAVCLGVHGIFAQDAFQELIKSGAQKVVTSNSIFHSSNEIDLSPILSQEMIRRIHDGNS